MRVAIYARVSSEKQDTDLSLSAQLRALREYAARNGHIIAREYVDEAESGRSIDRPGFKQMVAASRQKSPPFDAILVWKLSRFARSREDSIVFKALLRKHGVQVVSITEPFEDTPTGKLLEAIIESLDEFYSANLGQEVLRGMRESASRGFYVASHTPYGYRRVKVRDGNKDRAMLEVDPHHASVVARIFKEFLGGAGIKDIARALNTEGVSAPMGKRWGNTTLYRILVNEAYTGILVWGRTIKSSQKMPPIRIESAWE
ncbi:recombinase family protein, partial [bacterium]